MALRRLVFTPGLVLAIVVIVPTSALAGAHGIGGGPKTIHRPPVNCDRPIYGRSVGINTVNLQTGAATYKSFGWISDLGAVTGTGIQTITVTGPNTLSFTGTGITVTANGDELFASISGTGTLASTAATTTVNTITGGTGRFVGATGTFTVTSVSKPISTVGAIETFAFTSTTTGRISYQLDRRHR